MSAGGERSKHPVTCGCESTGCAALDDIFLCKAFRQLPRGMAVHRVPAKTCGHLGRATSPGLAAQKVYGRIPLTDVFLSRAKRTSSSMRRYRCSSTEKSGVCCWMTSTHRCFPTVKRGLGGSKTFEKCVSNRTSATSSVFFSGVKA